MLGCSLCLQLLHILHYPLQFSAMWMQFCKMCKFHVVLVLPSKKQTKNFDCLIHKNFSQCHSSGLTKLSPFSLKTTSHLSPPHPRAIRWIAFSMWASKKKKNSDINYVLIMATVAEKQKCIFLKMPNILYSVTQSNRNVLLNNNYLHLQSC